MARVRRIFRHVEVEKAKLGRRCHHDRSHVIRRGEMCLVIRNENGRGGRNYCWKCARAILKLGWHELKTAAQAFAETPAATHSPTAVSCCEATEAAGARQPSQAGQRTIRQAKADRLGEMQVTQEKLLTVGGPTSDREPARYIRKKL